jgi:hypothetical protein
MHHLEHLPLMTTYSNGQLNRFSMCTEWMEVKQAKKGKKKAAGKLILTRLMVLPPHLMHPLEKCGLSRQESFDAFNDLVGKVMDEHKSAMSYKDTDSRCIQLLYTSYCNTLIGVKHPDLTNKEKKEASKLKSLKKNYHTWLLPILFELHYFINVVHAELCE